MKIIFAILNLIRFLPRPILLCLARIVGYLAYFLVIPRRKIGLINLRKCYPQQTIQQHKSLLKKHFYHMALLILEYGLCWYASAEQIKSLVHYQDKHYLDDILSINGKVILLYPHFTAFELAVYALNQDISLTSVYSHQKNSVLDQKILNGRNRYNNVFLVGRTEGLRSVIKHIRQYSAPFLYLPDQDFGRKDSVFVTFFDVPTATITGLGRIAQLTNAKIVPLIPTRLSDGTVNLRFYPAWENFPSGDDIKDAQRMNDFIEQRVREQPEQYFWLHKRFKTRPDGEKSFY